MGRTLRVLHLEDDPDDAFLIERALRGAGYQTEITLARTPQDFEEAIGRQGFDLIVSDNAMPGFDGAAALELARAKQPDAPVVVVSGSLDPEVAVRHFQSGAADFVSKDHLWRLPLAVARALGGRAKAWQADAMRRLVGVVQQLSLARHLEEVMAIVRTAARELTGADGATFVLREGEQCFYAEEDAIAPLWKGSRFPLSSCISGWAMLHRQAVAIRDIYADPRIPHDAYRPTFVKSLAMVPIRSEAPIGAIGTYWARVRDVAPEELQVLQALADTTSVALANVELIEGLEKRVAERTRELAAANQELQAFSYSIAHDLRSPLFAIDSYSQLIAEEQRSRLGADANDMLARIGKSARDMQGMIQALLWLANLGRGELARDEVDLSKLARDLIAQKRAASPERVVQVHVEDGLVARGDPHLLAMVLDNLLGNAWKYTAKRERAEIRFERVEKDGEQVFVVSDDGAGFDMRFAQKLFLPFQRLHSSAQFSGNGIGLATAQRIVQRHGGRIWAEAEPERGARFYFTLP